MYETAYFVLLKAVVEAITKIKKLDIKEAIETLESGMDKTDQIILSWENEKN